MFTISLMDERIRKQFIKTIEERVGKRKTSRVTEKLMQGYIDGKFHIEVD